MHPLDILSAFILSCSKYLWWDTSCHYANHFCNIRNSLIILMEQFTAANFQSLLFCISKSYFHFFSLYNTLKMLFLVFVRI